MEEIIDVGSINHKESMAVSLAGPGIMLLSTSMRLLYKDRRAWELCRQIIRSQDGKTANGLLPPAVVSLVKQIQRILDAQTEPKDWEQIQLKRVVNTPHSSILLWGTALIDHLNAHNRILIVISKVGIGDWQDSVIIHAIEEYSLTAREATVIQHLMKGWTNKEIANEMRLTEQTIKEHFKHISKKTGTTTRTGILLKIIHSGLCHALAGPHHTRAIGAGSPNWTDEPLPNSFNQDLNFDRISYVRS